MKNNIAKNYSKNEKGIAIVFTIGLLALISSIALLYVLTTSLNNKAAKNNNDLVSARMLARSAINRAMIAMKLYTGDLNNLKSRSVDYTLTSIEATEDLDTLLPTTVKGIEYYTTANYTAATPKPTWHYIKVKNASGTDVIIGRIVFSVAQVASESGWIMVGAAVDSGQATVYYKNHGGQQSDNAVTEYGSPASQPTSAVSAPPQTARKLNGELVVGRPGRDVSEISLYLFHESQPGGFLTETHLKKMSSEEVVPGGKMPVTGWGSADMYFDALGIKDDETKNKHLEYFSFGNPPDVEAFWIDNTNSIKDSDELYHRFNLARTDWDSLTVNDILSTPDRFYDSNNNIIEANTKAISWLNSWNDPGNFPNSDSARHQIAANLIDYCDIDIEATTDSEDAPTYVGLEKCPYINEISIKFSCNIIAADKTTYREYQAQVIPNFLSVEVVNMYDLVTGGSTFIDLNAIVKMDWEFTVAGKTYTRTSSNIDQADILIDNADAYRYSAPTDKFNDQSWHNTPLETTDSTLSECNKIENIKIKSLTVKLEDYDDGTFYDFSYILDSDLIVDSNITSSASYFQASVADSRQNLLADDWADSSYGNSDINTLGFKNDNFLPNPGGDADSEPLAEVSGQPWDISTAYIRNAPMESPWELGAIHRGKAWHTLNLKRYNSSQGMSGGGHTCSDGDANILDQIKMTDNYTTQGKINLNASEPLILKALLYGIYTNSNLYKEVLKKVTTTKEQKYKNPGTQDFAPTYMVTEFLSEILTDNIILETTSSNLKTRSSVVTNITDFSNNSLGLSQTNDATQEEIIGKFINLTKADEIKTNQVTIVAVAQTIDDIGGDITVYKDLNQDGDILDANEQVTNTQFGTYDQYADKITATQKVLIILYKSPYTNKLGIRRFEYIDN